VNRAGLPISLLIVAVTTAALGLATMVSRIDRRADGLRADYFRGTSWQGDPIRTGLEPFPGTNIIEEAWHGSTPQTFSVTWSGVVVILREGPVRFGTVSDRQSSVFVDGRLVVDNAAGGEVRSAVGSTPLTWGAHNIFVRYSHDGGPVHLEVLWAAGESPLQPVPASALHARRPRPIAIVTNLVLRAALSALQWTWVASLVGCGLELAWIGGHRLRRALDEEGLWNGLRWILLGSIFLNVIGFWWGLPSIWVRDELTPGVVIGALEQRFSNGWFDRWPPMHYYVLATTMSPVLLLQHFGRIDMFAGWWPSLLTLTTRLVSLAAASGTLVAAALVGSRAFGIRAGLFGAAVFGLAAPFVFYAKTANLDAPFIFWVALSLVFYQQLVSRGRVRDYVLFAAAATGAICTKDQAYALYAFVPFVVLLERWRSGGEHGQPWWRGVIDRRTLAAVVTAVALFAICHNLLFNFHGFLEHVRYITGPGSRLYRGFPDTAAGRLALLMLTLELVELSWGWPLTLVGVAGVWLALRSPRNRIHAVWLLLPAVSYYVTFINVVLYNYDRFVLPICLVLALFAGLALDRFLRSARIVGWRSAVVAGIFAYTTFYSATVDALMLNDSRFAVEQWVREQVRADELVGVSGPHELLPRLGVPTADISTVPDLTEARPAYYVLNADYAAAVPADTAWGDLIGGLHSGTLGYRLAMRVRQPSPWPWLPGAHPAFANPRRETPAYWASILRDINPTIEVFQRDRSAAGQ
jgi:hypothetical protein